MAGRGPNPDPDHARRNADTIPHVDLGPPVGDKAPKLPNARDYSKATRDWYKTWCDSPQSSQFTGTDWQRLHMLAPLVNLYFEKPTVQLMTEIRLQEAKLGGLVGDRIGLRWRLPRRTTPEGESETQGPDRTASRDRPDPRLT